MEYSLLEVEHHDQVTMLRLKRPDAPNALSIQLIAAPTTLAL